MVVSWTWRILKAPTRVIIEGGRLQARANLNGGELDEEPVLRHEKGQNKMTWVQKKGTKESAQPSDRPKKRITDLFHCRS